MKLELTRNMLERQKEKWSKIAGEEVKISWVGCFYAYGNELACLRLGNNFKLKGRVFYSENLKTWVFALESDMNWELNPNVQQPV